MAEWVALGVVAALLYIVECLTWIEAGAVACFKKPLRDRWKCAEGAALPGNDRGGFLIVDPTNVSGAVVGCHYWPFSVSPDGLTNLPPVGRAMPTSGQRYLSFDQVETVRTEFGEIWINGSRFARVHSSVLAADLVAFIQRIWKCPAGERAAEIKAAIEDTLDNQAAASVWSEFGDRTQNLAACCAGFLGYTFMACPIALFLIGPYRSWPYLLAGWLAFSVGISVAFFRTHARMYPGCAYERWVQATCMILLPVAAIRCLDRLSRDALCRYDAAILASMLCGSDEAVPVFRAQLIDMAHASDSDQPHTSDLPAGACVQWFSRVTSDVTDEALDRLTIAVFQPPVPDDQMMTCYCPRCHSQFRSGASSSCPACPHVQLVAFEVEAPRAVVGA